MITFRELLESKKISIALKYYGIQDLATGWEVKIFIENADFFDDVFSRFPITGLNNLDDYYSYLFYKKLAAMEDAIPSLIHDSHKRIIAKLSEKAKMAIAIIGTGDVIRYINSNYHDIFDEDKSAHDMKSITIDFISKYCNGIDRDVFDFLSRKYGYLLINKFDQFEKTFERYPELFDNVYPTGHLEEVSSLGLEITLDIWYHFSNKTKSNLKDCVVSKIEVLTQDVRILGEKLSNNSTMRDIMRIEDIIRKVLLFLRKIRSPKANAFERYAKKASDLLSQDLIENGQSFEFEIPVNEIIKKWKGIKKWGLRLLCITHRIKLEEDKLLCNSQLSIKPEEIHHFLDEVTTNIATDDFFTISHQRMLSCLASLGTGTIIGIIRDQDLFIDYLNCVSSAVSIISESLEVENEHLLQDVGMLRAMVQLTINNRDMDKTAVAGMCYGAAMFLCAFTEKILRLFYIFLVKEDIYIPIKKTTLGELLSVDNPYIVKVFGEEHVRHLAFFLQQTGQSNVGYNYRNALAHWIDMSSEEMTIIFLAEMIWLFTDILNTVFWYCSSNIGGKEND